MVLLADQDFAAGVSSALGSGITSWLITLACYAGIIIAAVPIPKWLIPTRDPTIKPVTPVKPIDPDDSLVDEARQFIEARKKIDAAILAERDAKQADNDAHDANIAKLEADKRTADSLIIVGEPKPEVTP